MRSMQCFAFGPSSIKPEIARYHPISGQDSNSHGNIPVTNEMELGSSHTLSLDQILTNSCDVTPSALFGYSQISTSTDSASLNSMTSSFECKPPRSTNPTSTNILGTTNSLTSPFTYISTRTDSDVNIFERQQNPILKPSWEQDDKSFAERTILLPNPKSPPCYFPPVSNAETIHDIQCSNRMTCAEASLNSTLSDCYFQMGSVSEPNQATTTSFVAPRPQVDSVYNYETDAKGRLCCNWWERHPYMWTQSEVLDWIKFTINQEMLNPTYHGMDGFKDLTSGACLRHMTYEEFLIRDPQYGHLLFHCFKQLLEIHAHASMGWEIRDVFCSQHSDQVDIKMEQATSVAQNTQNSLLLNTFVPTQTGSNHSASYTNLVVPKYQVQVNEMDAGWRIDASCHASNSRSSRFAFKTFDQFENPKRGPGRPRLHPGFKSNIAGNKKTKMLPLWEFIYSTLQNGRFNPSIIKWEDEAIGKFRFVHSEKFAKLWGSVKNNENMNYEKLSRAMRHYYGKDIMERVEGRRLVYRFLSSALERLRAKQDPDVPLSEMQRLPELNQYI